MNNPQLAFVLCNAKKEYTSVQTINYNELTLLLLMNLSKETSSQLTSIVWAICKLTNKRELKFGITWSIQMERDTINSTDSGNCVNSHHCVLNTFYNSLVSIIWRVHSYMHV